MNWYVVLITRPREFLQHTKLLSDTEWLQRGKIRLGLDGQLTF